MRYCPFSLHKKSQHIRYLAYISSRIFQGEHHSTNLVVSSHPIQPIQCLLFVSTRQFPFFQVH